MRLASVVSDVPKPLAPVAGKPFLDHVLAFLAASGVVRRVILSIGHMAEQITEHYTRHPAVLPLTFSMESTPLGTGGAVLLARQRIKGDHFLVLNGDSIVGVELRQLVARHISNGADASLTLVQVSDSRRYGSVKLDGDRVVSFEEKNPEAGPGLINAGLYVFRFTSLATFPVAECSLERDILPRLLTGYVRGEVTSGPFIDIGLPEVYAKADEFVRMLPL
jgi:NDP-sugar pyrophosphorylase family protein